MSTARGLACPALEVDSVVLVSVATPSVLDTEDSLLSLARTRCKRPATNPPGWERLPNTPIEGDPAHLWIICTSPSSLIKSAKAVRANLTTHCSKRTPSGSSTSATPRRALDGSRQPTALRRGSSNGPSRSQADRSPTRVNSPRQPIFTDDSHRQGPGAAGPALSSSQSAAFD